MMQLLVVSIFAILLGTQIQPSLSCTELSLQLCMRNRTVSVQMEKVCPSSKPNIREDYLYMPSMGSHKLHRVAKSWNEARKICNEEGAHLAIINSKAEEAILVDMLKQAETLIKGGLNTEEAYLGIHDFYREGEWVTIFGESLYTTGYANWSPTYHGGQPDNAGHQNCGAVLTDGGMDDVNCNDKFAFFCEIPLPC